MLLLASLFVSQLSYQDIEFEKVQIDCIKQISKPKDYDNVLPWRHAALLRQLDCNSLECRKLATDELVNMGEAAFPILIWGTHAKSAEVKNKCGFLLGKFYLCPTCEGLGYCQFCLEHVYCRFNCNDYIKHIEQNPRHNLIHEYCSVCTGTGDIRFEYNFHYNKIVFKEPFISH